jgi:hypothetical protein
MLVINQHIKIENKSIIKCFVFLLISKKIIKKIIKIFTIIPLSRLNSIEKILKGDINITDLKILELSIK